jgi:hypothetical protein
MELKEKFAQNRRKETPNYPSFSVEFTEEELDTILKYQEIIKAETIQEAIMHAVCYMTQFLSAGNRQGVEDA